MSKTFQTVQVVICVPLRQCFEYLLPEGVAVQPGVRVKVPFGKKEVIGIVWKNITRQQEPEFKLKTILSVLDEAPILTPDLLRLCEWSADYYHVSLGEVMRSVLPAELRRGRVEAPRPPKGGGSSPFRGLGGLEPLGGRGGFALTSQQQQAVDTVLHSSGFQCFLLEGITGSGKTEVYLELAQACITKGQQVLVLVPEISLTPQMIARFEQRLSAPLFKLHSRMTPQQRFKMWLAAKQGVSGVWIGTRSAIFTPFLNLGLVVVDEEHDYSFKQQTGFRYSGRDLAVMRGKFANASVVLGSATPSLETLHNVLEKRYQHLQLTERVNDAMLPQIKLIDMRNHEGILSPILQKAIQERLDKSQQVLLFVNRRGFAPVLMCHRCGDIVGCKNCDVHLVIHQHPPQLACHHCGLIQRIVTRCTKCESTKLFPLGFGSQRLENVLKETFPTTAIVRIDSDTTRRKGELERQLAVVQKGESCILVGTQMLAKGHHFPNLTLVAILDVDTGLLNPDFRAPERMGQLLTQVAGRAGRGNEAGLVLIQTHHPDHPLLHSLLKEGYGAFARKLLLERKESELPPVTYMAHIYAESRSQANTVEFLQGVKNIAPQLVEIFGPIPSPIEKKAGQFRSYLNLLSKNRKQLHQMLEQLVAILERHTENHRRVRWLVEVDPQEIV